MLSIIKTGLSLFLSGSVLLFPGISSNSYSESTTENANIIYLSTPTENMTNDQKLDYFENIYSNSNINDYQVKIETESFNATKNANISYLSTPTENMTNDQKLDYFENIYSSNKFTSSNTIIINPNTRDATIPSTSDFYNLSVNSYNASGTFCASYLYTLKCFAPNSSNNLEIRGSASATYAPDVMYISVYDVTAHTAGTEFPVYSVAENEYTNTSYFDFAFAIGPLNSNHLYAVRLSPANAFSRYDTYFTVSHS